MDQHALLCFHKAAGRSWWPERMKWDPEGDPGQWDGVELDADGQVAMLHMEIKSSEINSSEAIRFLRTLPRDGFIAPELRSLRNLKSLRLIKLALRGGIPEDLAALQQLTILDLSKNTLEGVMTSKLATLKRLTHLNLSYNTLEGGIPGELEELQELVVLNLSYNKFKGNIPPQLGRLGKLLTLDLRNNRLEGTIPKHLSWLSSLEELSLRGNNLEGSIPTELARLGQLERLFLSENKLTGRIPQALSKLGKLRKLGLRSNNLEGAFPPELTRLSRLEKLYVRNNRLNGFMPEMAGMSMLKTISFSNNELEWDYGGTASGQSASGPAGLMSLTQLETIYLNNNNLRGRIPKGMAKLNQLARLSLSKNMLEGDIPVELARIDRLMVLDLSHNNLQGTIPADLGDLKQLSILDLSNNKLQGIIPAELTSLDQLLKLNVSYNCLEGLWDHTKSTTKDIGNDSTQEGRVLPQQLAELIAWLKDLEGMSWLVPNPFHEPPEAVVQAGMEDIEMYFEDVFAEGLAAERRGMKAVIVGQEGAGKTSLWRSIQNRRPSRTSGAEESTVHLDIAYVDLDGVAINVYDCAGQVCYYGLLQMFITRRTVCLVVCDMEAFGLRERGLSEAEQLKLDVQKLEELNVHSWLRFLSWRLPGCDVILVGTKCDLLPEGTVGDTAERVERASRRWLEYWLDSGMRINVEPGVSLTSCAEEISPSAKFLTFLSDLMGGKTNTIAGDWSCDWRRPVAGARTAKSLLHRITHKSEGGGYRGGKMVLPRSWDCALILLDALREGRNSVEFERHQVDLFPNSRALSGGDRTLACPGMMYRKLVTIWLEVVNVLRGMGRNIPNAERALEGALLIREYEGSLLRQEYFVFLDASWLAGVLKPVLLHNPERRDDGAISLGEIGNRLIVLVEENEKASWRRLEQDGILERQLAQILWPGDLWEHVLQTLKSIDLAFPHSGRDNDEELVVLMRLEENRPEMVGRDLDKHRGQRAATLKVVWDLPRGFPPGAIEKVLTKCCTLSPPTRFWRFGVLLRGSLAVGGMDGRFYLLIEYSEGQKELTMEAYGDETSVAPWAVLSYAMSVMLRMTAQFPGLPYEGALRCPEHPERMLMVTSKAKRPGEGLLYDRGCGVCREEFGDKGALAMQLLMMVDVSQPRDEALERITRMFLRLHQHPCTLGPKDNVQLEALTRVVQELEHVVENVDCFPATGPGLVAADRGAQAHEDPRPWLNVSSTSEDVRRLLSERRVIPQLEGIQQQLDNLSRVIQQQGSREEQLEEVMGHVVMMMEAMRAEASPTPRLAVLLDKWNFECERGLSERDQCLGTWWHRLSEDSKNRGGRFGKKMRLFPVCARTFRLVPCGDNGQGYEIWRPRKWLTRMVVVTKVLVQAMLQVTCSTLGAVAAGALASNLLGEATEALFDLTQEEAVSTLQARLESLEGSEDGELIEGEVDPSLQHPVSLEGAPYEELRHFIEKVENTARRERLDAIREAIRRNSPLPDFSFVFFKDVMEQTPAHEGHGTVQWVLRS